MELFPEEIVCVWYSDNIQDSAISKLLHLIFPEFYGMYTVAVYIWNFYILLIVIFIYYYSFCANLLLNKYMNVFIWGIHTLLKNTSR